MKKNKFISLNGNTNLYLTVGCPTDQVRSPKDITEEFLKLGLNALILSIEVSPRNANDFFIGIKGVKNIRKIIDFGEARFISELSKIYSPSYLLQA